MTPPVLAGGYRYVSARPAPIEGRRRAVVDALPVVVPSATRRLLTAWIALALGCLVIAGLFAILVAFTRMPAVELLHSATLFNLALVAHVTFALTVWFAAFAGVLWVHPAQDAPAWSR